MALSQGDGRLENHAADEATGALVWKRRQNRDGIDGGRNYLDTGAYGRGKVYGSVRLIEGGLGQVGPRHYGYADCSCQEEEN